MKAPETSTLVAPPKNPNSLYMPKAEAQAILWDENPAFEITKDEIVSTGRWSVHHRLVVYEFTSGKYYIANYSVGATENQDEQAWEYEKEVEFKLAEAYEETVVRYRVKE